MIQTKIFRNKNLEQLGKELCDFQNNNGLVGSGSIPFQIDSLGNYQLMAFFKIDKTNEEELKLFNNNIKEITNKDKTDEVNTATQKQLKALRKMGYLENELKNITKKEAWYIINNNILPNRKKSDYYLNKSPQEIKESDYI